MAGTFLCVHRWGSGLSLLLAAALCLGPGQAWAETGAEATSTRDEPIRCSVVLGPEAPDLEVFAAHELSRYLRELYGIQSELVRTLGAGSGLSILLGSPQTNPAFQRISGPSHLAARQRPGHRPQAGERCRPGDAHPGGRQPRSDTVGGL